MSPRCCPLGYPCTGGQRARAYLGATDALCDGRTSYALTAAVVLGRCWRRRYAPHVADTEVGSTGPDADRWAQRERLWQQLLHGELTEVYQVVGVGFQGWTLGLEPISVGAYQYNRADGMPISDAERDEIARELSAQRYWTVGSNWVYWNQVRSGIVMAWDRHFIERAQVALIVLRPRRIEVFLQAALTALRRRRRTDEFAFSAGIDYDRAQVKFYKELREYALYYSPRYLPRPPYSFVVAQYLLEKYPDKTLVVSNPQQIKQLKRLRIPRDRCQSP